MSINWFTVLAQMINFLVLIWLLKKFLYKPILDAINAREKLITSQLHGAEQKNLDAERIKNDFTEKNIEFEKQRDNLLQKAMDEVNSKRQVLLEEARAESLALKERLQNSLKDEQQNINRNLAQRTEEEVFKIAKKTLKDLANADLEKNIINIFIQEVKNADDEKKKELIKLSENNGSPIIVKTSFPLNDETKAEIKNAINAFSENKNQVAFDISAENICGVEWKAGGYKLSWNLSDYISSIEQVAQESLNQILDNKKVE